MQFRDYKIFKPGNYYHIFNRGVNKQAIFVSQQDYIEFLKRFKIILGLDSAFKNKTHIKPLPMKSFSVISYCLMSNHFHILLKQNSEIGINKLMLKLCTSYSIYFNKKYDRVGTLFQDRFKAKLVENDEYALYLSAYIHNNPDIPENYPYSSYKEIISNYSDSICDGPTLLSWVNNSEQEYKKFVKNFKQNKILQNLSSF